jgi:hypothetical protein
VVSGREGRIEPGYQFGVRMHGDKLTDGALAQLARETDHFITSATIPP